MEIAAGYNRPFPELGQRLTQDAELLVARWRERIAARSLRLQAPHRCELQARLPDFLRGLGAWLANPDKSTPSEYALAGMEQGELSWRAGWRLTDVLRDYQSLRFTLGEWILDTVEVGFRAEAQLAIDLALDDALTAATIAFTAFQEAYPLSDHGSGVVSVTRHVGEAIITIDDRAQVVSFNEAAEKLFGYAASVILKQNVRRLLPEPYCSWPDRQVTDLLRAEQAKFVGTPREVIARRSDGTQFPAEVAVSQFQQDGRHFFTGIVRDITNRKEAEERLRSMNELLEQRVAERTRTAERRASQLRALTAELTQIEQRERRRLAGELHDYLAQLLVVGKMRTVSLRKQSSDPKALSLIEELIQTFDESLTYTRTLIAELSPTILYDAGLIPALNWLGEQMQRHGLFVHVKFDTEQVPLHEDKAILLYQSVRELLFNVVKHAGATEVTVRVQRRLEHVVVQVIDAGKGFDVAGRKNQPGSGHFGLFSIAERLEALGGKFEIVSSVGRGTTATLTVPLLTLTARPAGKSGILRRTEAPAAPPPPPPVDKSRIRVLIVDDHEMVRKGVRSTIEADPSLEVVGEACDGRQALDQARRLRPDAVVMDINLPGMNGLEATRKIVGENPAIAVIGLSVHDDKELASAFRHVGGLTYLTKGGAGLDLCNAIRLGAEARQGRAVSI